MKTQSIREFIEQYGDINLLNGTKYNGYLYLRGTQITSLPENLTTIGGSLYLRGTQITSLPENLTTIGGSLYLEGTQITSLPENLTTIGGYLYLANGRRIERFDSTKGKLPTIFHWKYHDREYIKADGLFQRVLSHKGNVYQVQNIGSTEVAYLVVGGIDICAHGSTLHEAHSALQAKMLQRKSIAERIADFKAEFDSGKKYPASEFFKWHHILTGSCEFGRREFCRQHNIDLDNDTYTVEEFIELTKNAYGGEVIRQIK